jgi:hypothetical protein
VVTPIRLPTATATLPGLPPTWTPIPSPESTKVEGSSNVLRDTATPYPTNTFVVLPSFTPSVTPRTGVSGGTCVITSQTPSDNTSIDRGSVFTTSWTIKNTSKESWRADSTDIRWTGVGDRVHNGNDVLDMSQDVGINSTFSLGIDMTAPSNPGSYVSNWKLAVGSKTVCNFYITFAVP